MFDRLKNNTDNNDQACSAERYACAENTIEEIRHNTYDRKSDCANEDNVVEHFCEIFAGRLTWSDARYKTPCFFIFSAISIGLKVMDV